MDESKEEEKPLFWFANGVPCYYKEQTIDLYDQPTLQKNLTPQQRRRTLSDGVVSIDPDLHFGFTPESQTHTLPSPYFEEDEQQQRRPQQNPGTSRPDRSEFLHSSSYIPYVFPSPLPTYQPNRTINVIGVGMMRKSPRDMVYKVLRPIPGTASEFTATIVRYPSASEGGTEPVIEKVENFNAATDFMVKTTVSASGTKEDSGETLAQVSEEGPLLKRCKSVGSNLS